MLEQILAGEFATKDELAVRGVKWPESNDDRDPRHKAAATTLPIFDEGDVGNGWLFRP